MVLHLLFWSVQARVKFHFLPLQVSVLFADLHDTPGRMQDKGVISVSISLYKLFSVALS